MTDFNKENKNLDYINEQIEKELNEYTPENNTNNTKKEYLTLKFLCTLLLAALLILGILKKFLIG